MNKVYCVFFATALLLSCKKNDDLMYQQDPRVYFYKYPNNSEKDSIAYSFAQQPIGTEKDTVYAVLRIMGDTVNYDREVNLFAADSSTAVEGRDYTFGPKIIHAGAFSDSLPIYITKSAAMDTTTLRLYLRIGDSKDFKAGYVDNGYNLTGTGGRLNFLIAINNTLTKPTNWDRSLASYFGTYSKVKFQFLISITGILDWSSLYPATLAYIQQQAKTALLDYQAEHGTSLLDENGNPVTF